MIPRLVNPFEVEIAPFDTAATAALDPPGDADSGFDDVFREPRVYDAPDGGKRATTRREGPSFRFWARVEVGPWDQQNVTALGLDPRTEVVVIASMTRLWLRGLVDLHGRPAIKRGDRLVGIYEVRTGKPARILSDDEALFVTHVREAEYGIGGRRNLLYVQFARRRTGVRT